MGTALKTLAISACLVASATANSYSGNEMLAEHQSVSPRRHDAPLHYIMGIIDSEAGYRVARIANPASAPKGFFSAVLTPTTFCLPAGVTYGQAYDVVIQWVQGHAQIRHMDAQHHVRMALNDAWPCPSN